ncbi:hypothetical protein KCU64_g23173, partial [Aureobasidium melanogenum]
DGDQSHSVYQTPATAPIPSSEKESYFTEQPQQSNGLDRDVERVDHADVPTKGSGPTNTQSLPGTRPNLERSWQTERPKAMPRSATIMNALQRSTSHSHTRQHSQTDDSDWSSSSEGESEGDQHAGKQKRRKMQRGQSFTILNVGKDKNQAGGKASKRDGRLNISVSEAAGNGYMAKTFAQTVQNHLSIPHRHPSRDEHGSDSNSEDHHIKTDNDSQDEFSDDAASIASSFHETIKRPRL